MLKSNFCYPECSRHLQLIPPLNELVAGYLSVSTLWLRFPKYPTVRSLSIYIIKVPPV